jgi:hypothetical protein
MTLPGAAGLTMTLAHLTGIHRTHGLGGIHPATYVFVYVCFLVLGLAFGVTAWQTRPTCSARHAATPPAPLRHAKPPPHHGARSPTPCRHTQPTAVSRVRLPAGA